MHLPNLDVASKSDPQVVVTLSDARGKRIIGQTEVVADNLNPKFATAIPLDYYFEEVQTLSFEIFDVDATSRDYIGQVTCTVGDIFGSRGQELVRQVAVKTVKLIGKAPMMAIRGEEVKGMNATVNFRLSGSHLDKKDPGPFAKSDPYLLLYKEYDDGKRQLVHRTNTILNTLNPTWQPFTLHMSVLCDGNPKMKLYIEVFDWDKHSDDDLIGVCRTNLEHLLTRPILELINPKKQAKKSSYKNSGTLNILDISVINEYTFLEYLAGGTQLNLMVGIDYTASNGNPAQPGSLHFRDPSGALNQYGNAIVNVGNILLPYDYDGNVPVYGFGGKLPNGETSHCFALTGNPATPEVPGVAGVMDVYSRSFQWVALHGPTNFAPLIKQACTIAAQYHAMAQDVAAYLLLLIITDGEITDMNATVDAIVEASGLPMSIVIVGVGNADFSKMDVLDADGKLLQGRNGVARRDIVQFVPYNKFKDPVRLTAATLAELPGQLVEYMKTFNIKPKSRVVTDVMALANQVQSVTVTTTAGAAVAVPIPGGFQQPIAPAPVVNVAPAPSPGMYAPAPAPGQYQPPFPGQYQPPSPGGMAPAPGAYGQPPAQNMYAPSA